MHEWGVRLMTRWLYLSVALTIAALAGTVYVYGVQYDQLPDAIPTHWDIHFVPDQWVPKTEALWHLLAIPGVMALITLLTVVLPWLSPTSFQVEPFRDTYGYIMALVAGWRECLESDSSHCGLAVRGGGRGRLRGRPDRGATSVEFCGPDVRRAGAGALLLMALQASGKAGQVVGFLSLVRFEGI